MRILAGEGSTVHFTALSNSSKISLASAFSASKAGEHLAKGSAHTSGILELMKSQGISSDKVCLLDPKAEQVLSPEDAERFSWFLFGVRFSSPDIGTLLTATYHYREF